MTSKLNIWYDGEKRSGAYIHKGKTIIIKDVNHKEFCDILYKHINGVK